MTLRELRRERGLRRDFISSKLKITPDHLSKIERGKCNLTLNNAESLSGLYNVGIDEIIKAYKGRSRH